MSVRLQREPVDERRMTQDFATESENASNHASFDFTVRLLRDLT